MRGRFSRVMLAGLGKFVAIFISKILFSKYLLGAGKLD